jgi:hypothetical protein
MEIAHLSTQESVDILEDPQKQFRPFLSLLLVLLLQAEAFLLCLRQERLEFFNTFSQMECFALVLLSRLRCQL